MGLLVASPKGPSTQIVGFQGPKTTQSMDFWDLKPYYLGTWTLWVVLVRFAYFQRPPAQVQHAAVQASRRLLGRFRVLWVMGLGFRVLALDLLEQCRQPLTHFIKPFSR